MDKESLQDELDAAYKSLDKSVRQIKNLLIERKQLNMTIELLEAGGFISEGKLEEARQFIRQFKTS